jgi:hypothetical protein
VVSESGEGTTQETNRATKRPRERKAQEDQDLHTNKKKQKVLQERDKAEAQEATGIEKKRKKYGKRRAREAIPVLCVCGWRCVAEVRRPPHP